MVLSSHEKHIAVDFANGEGYCSACGNRVGLLFIGGCNLRSIQRRRIFSTTILLSIRAKFNMRGEYPPPGSGSSPSMTGEYLVLRGARENPVRARACLHSSHVLWIVVSEVVNAPDAPFHERDQSINGAVAKLVRKSGLERSANMMVLV